MLGAKDLGIRVVAEEDEFRPQATNIGNLEVSRSPTTERRDCGQVSGAPRGDVDQSCPRISAPMAPPSTRKLRPVTDTGLSSIDGVRCGSYLLAPAPLFLPLEEAQAGPNDLTGVLVLAGGDLGVDECVQFSRQGDVAGLVDRHAGEDPVTGWI
jgi:hypothetical protein